LTYLEDVVNVTFDLATAAGKENPMERALFLTLSKVGSSSRRRRRRSNTGSTSSSIFTTSSSSSSSSFSLV